MTKKKPRDSLQEVSLSDLQTAVEQLHSCRAILRGSATVKETFQDKTAWAGVVHVFEIEGHPQATTCYAWSSPVESSERRKFYAVLHIPPVDSPEKAVRAAIVQDYRTEQKSG